MPSLLLQLMSTYYWKNSSKEDGRKKRNSPKMNIQFKSKMKAGILSFYGMNIAKENASAETKQL